MDEYEYEEETAVVMVDLHGVFDSNVLLKDQESMKIIGLDTEEPFLQIGSYVFSGKYEDTMGTIVFFENPSETEENGESPCICKTDKKLSMKRVFLEKKCQESEAALATSEVQVVANNIVADNEIADQNCDPATCNDGGKSSPLPQDASAVIESSNNELQNIYTEHVDNTLKAALPVEGGKETADLDVMNSVEEPSSHMDCSLSASSVTKEFPVHNAKNPQVEELKSEHLSEDSTRSSDFDDLVIVSEIDESNEASCDHCDSSLVTPEAKCLNSEVEMDDAEVEQLSGVVLDDRSENSPSTSSAVSGTVTGVVSSLVSKVQIGLSSATGQAEIVDSASHLIRNYSSRLSDSSLPLICDSASSGNNLNIAAGQENEGLVSSIDQSVDTCNNGNQITTSQGISSDLPKGASQSEDVFECEAMDVDVDNSVNTTDQLSLDSESGSEVMELAESILSDSLSSIGDEPEYQVNSTFNQSSQQSSNSDTADISENEGGAHSSSQHPNQQIPVSAVKDSVDSTSNQVFPSVKNVSNSKTSDIDSTTNERGDKLMTVPVDSAGNASGASSSEVPNGSIDSTINNVTVIIEEVDFEMREATQMMDDSDLSDCHKSSELNQSIDSTTSNRANESTDTELTGVDLVRSDESIPICEVSASCSGISPGKLSSSLASESSSPCSDNISHDQEENSLPCKVSESFIDEKQSFFPDQTRCPSSIGNGSGSHTPNPSSTRVRKPSQSSNISPLSLAGSSSNMHIMPSPSPMPCKVTGSQQTNKKITARPYISISREEMQKIVKLSIENRSKAPESVPSSSMASLSELEKSLLLRVAELSRQIQVCPLQSIAASSKQVSPISVVNSTFESNDIRLPMPAHMHSRGACTSSTTRQYIESVIGMEDCVLNLATRNPSRERATVESQSFYSSNIDPNPEEVVIDVVENLSVEEHNLNQSSHPPDTHDINANANEMESFTTHEQSDQFQWASSSSYSAGNHMNDIYESEIDIGNSNEVSESLEPRANGNADSHEIVHESMECEVTESNEGSGYMETSEVIASSSHQHSNSEVTESHAELNVAFFQDSANEPCGSSDELSAASDSDGMLCIVTDDSRNEGNDSHPSSSKEITDSNSNNQETAYAAADSPEAERGNDLCSSSSSNRVFSTAFAASTQADPVIEQHSNSELCSSSGNDQDSMKFNSQAPYILDEPLEQNEAEVAASCSTSHGDVAKSSTDACDAISGARGDFSNHEQAEVSGSSVSRRRCDSVSETEGLVDRSVELSEENIMEVSESCASSGQQLGCEVSESNVDLSQQNSFSEETDNCGPSDRGPDVVSDSTNIFNTISVVGVRGDDSSSCEVSESCIEDSGACPHMFISDSQNNAVDFEGTDGNVTCLPSESSSILHRASTSQSSNSMDRPNTSHKEPSSSDIRVSSASDSSCWATRSIMVSSANDAFQHYTSEANNIQLSNEGNDSSTDNAENFPGGFVRSPRNPVSGSLDQNPADSSGDHRNVSTENRTDQVPEGSDNSKLPSSTSN